MITEGLHPGAADIDAMSTAEVFNLMNDEDAKVARAVKKAKKAVCLAVEDAVKTIQAGGSVVYVGAGTSGRLGVLDASEMPPTFSTPPHVIRGIIAGGSRALTTSIEGAEDDESAGIDAVAGVSAYDMVVGITVSGGAPFVLSALKEAKRRGARCWLLTCGDVAYGFVDGLIGISTGPEIVAGSSRLKAGTATKMALNMLSTITMIRLGRVYKGYMVDVVPSNAKLKRRALRIIAELTGLSPELAAKLFQRAHGNAKTAVVMHEKGIDYAGAVRLLDQCGGSLRAALQC
ncbi:MAG: N-acetylmuramic acid 6-phosphate etherase [Candidatus Magnetominusculus sp. LBB02]|nr:N-acetylmuramic acid 6-phosphate etherase [Candidatus Magnetominusculus sp. LBB02]